MLKSISLQNFRNHKSLDVKFDKGITFIVGPNTSGKTNLLEAISFLAFGKSIRNAKDEDVVKTGQSLGKIKAETEEAELEIIIVLDGAHFARARKKLLVNGVSKSRINFSGNLTTVIFSPSDLDIVTDSPHLRREFLNSVLEQTDRDYRLSLSSYAKALRQRNALLDLARDSGVRYEKQFEYWDNLLIESGSVITQKREEFLNFVNGQKKDVFDFLVTYDKSIISPARLEQYKDAEVAAGVTLVGPHRDDFQIFMFDGVAGTTRDIKNFGSRGQQRLVILQLKLLQLDFIEKTLGQRPLLLLDDIFSELDEGNIKLVTEMIDKQQSIVTTTHEEFVSSKFKEGAVIELKKDGEKS